MKNTKIHGPETKASVQRSLRKLISEEWFAGQMYKLFITAAKVEDQSKICGILNEVAEDEIDDHLANLSLMARRYGYDVPSTFAEFEKYAGEEDVKAFKTFKSKKDANTYMKLALESEQRAVASYAEALQNKDLEDFYEIKQVMVNNYYDELEHLSEFGFMVKAFEMTDNADVIQQGIE